MHDKIIKILYIEKEALSSGNNLRTPSIIYESHPSLLHDHQIRHCHGGALHQLLSSPGLRVIQLLRLNINRDKMIDRLNHLLHGVSAPPVFERPHQREHEGGQTHEDEDSHDGVGDVCVLRSRFLKILIEETH